VITTYLSKVCSLTLVAFLMTSSVAFCEPSIPVINESGRLMKLTVKRPNVKKPDTIEFTKGQKKDLDISAPGDYDLSVSDADGRRAVISRVNLQQALAKNPKLRIVIDAKFFTPAKGEPIYIGPELNLLKAASD
jgi:hypothetical protein